jgi:hypothetical protein
VACVSGSLYRVQAGAASGKDEDRLLQGGEPAGRLSPSLCSTFWVFSFEPGRRCGGRERSASSRTAFNLRAVRRL